MIRFGSTTALIGGSFDPVHAGHLALAREIRHQAPEIEQIIFVPAALSPGKTAPAASAALRLRWLREAAAAEGCPVWDWELQQGGESFTVSTLAEAHARGAARDRLFWVVGADAYASLPSWREPARIRELCRLLVINRPGHALNRQDPTDRILAVPPHPASSSAIRRLLAQDNFAGAEAAGLLPALRAELEKALPANNPYARNLV